MSGQVVALAAVASALLGRYLLDFSVARTSGIVAFGQYSVVMSAGAMLAILAGLGMADIANQVVPHLLLEVRLGAVRAFHRQGVLICVALGLAAGCLIAIFLPAIPHRPWFIASSTLLVPALAVFTFQRQMRLLMGRRLLALFAPALMAATATVAVLVVALLGSSGASTALVAVGLSYALLAGALRTRSRKVVKAEPLRRGEARIWRRAGGMVLLSNAATVVTSQIDILAMAQVRGPAETGAYAASSRLSLLVTLALAGLIPLQGPALGRLFANGQTSECLREFRRSCWVTGVIGLCVLAILCLLGRPLLDGYVAGASRAYIPLIILAVGRCFSALTGPSAVMLIVMGKRREAAGAAWAGLFVTLGIIALAGPLYGGVGIAIGVAAGILIQNSLQYGLVRSRLRLRAGTQP